MVIPKFIEIKTVIGQRSALLSPASDGLKDVYVDNWLNGESTLEFSLPATSEKIEELTPECQIWAGGRVYSLLKDEAADIVRDEQNKLWAKFMAVERWKTDLETSFVEPYISNDPTIPTPADLAVIIVGGGSDLSGGLYTVGSAAHALYAVLNGSGWTLGTVDVTGTHDLEMEKASRLTLIKEIQNIWGGYLVWDSVNKIISLRDASTWQNYTGFQIRYAKNLKHITRTQSNSIITKLYCFGHDDLDIASVNGGLKYITNFSFTPIEYIGIYQNQDIYDAQELKDKATAELSLMCRPRYLYRVKMVDLRTLPEYSHEDFSVGDMADVIDPKIGTAKARIIRHKYNLFKPWDCEIELGDPQERLIEQLKASFDTADFIDGKYNGSGKSSGYSLENGTVHADKIVANSLIVGTNVQIGTAQDAAGVTTIIGNTVTTGYVNALGITADYVRANISISSPTITGGTLTVGTNSKIQVSEYTGSGEIRFINALGYGTGQILYNAGHNELVFKDMNDMAQVSIFGSQALDLSSNGPVNLTGSIIKANGYKVATENWVDSNYSPISHNHGNDYVKTVSGQNVRINVTATGVYFESGSNHGSIMFDT